MAALVRKLYIPEIGKTIAFGRNPPAPQKAAPLRLRSYMTGVTPPTIVGVPARPNWAFKAWKGLADPDGNLDKGDCCFAGIMHALCCLIAATGLNHPFPSQADAFALYTAVTASMGLTPFDPDDPSTDVGGDLPTVLNYCMAHGALADGSFKADGWLTADASDFQEVKTLIWLFGGAYKGVGLPDEWLNPAPSASGFRWDVAGDANMRNGHCIFAYGANDDGDFNDSWGLEGTVTAAALAKYFVPAAQGEYHAILWQDWKTVGQRVAPNAIAWDQLETDMAAFKAAAAA